MIRVSQSSRFITNRNSKVRGPYDPNELLLRISPNGRYLIDGNGDPYLLVGDTAWSGILQLNVADSEIYLADCEAKGFNSIILNLIDHQFADNPPNNQFGVGPFSGTPFQSSVNQSYFDYAKAFVNRAAQHGIVCHIDPCYLGFLGGSQGWYADIEAASSVQAQAWGAYVGSQFASIDNVTWHLFGDYNPPSHSRINSVQVGLASTDGRHTVIGTHYGPDVSGYDDPTSWMTIDLIYRYGGYVHQQVLAGYNALTMPTIFFEGWYEHENGSSVLDQRRQAWGSMTSGACGQFYGNGYIWGFGAGFSVGPWQDHLNDTARVQMGYLKNFFKDLAWWNLVPDQSNQFITAGKGSSSSSDYVTAARAGGTLGVAYLPTGSSGGAVTVAMSVFSAPVNVSWFNPRSGASQSLGTFPNSGSENFTATDGNDWVLLVRTP